MLRRILKLSSQSRILSLNKSFPVCPSSFTATSSTPNITFQNSFNFATKQKRSKEAETIVEEDDQVEENEYDGIEIIEEVDSNGALVKKIVDESGHKMTVEQCTVHKVDDKNLIKCSYGIFQLKGSLIPENKVDQIKNLYYVNDNVSINYIRKVLKSDQNGLVIFEPSSHYTNMLGLYNGYKRKVYSQFFGTSKKPRNPFKSCKTNKDIFNLNRRIKMQIKQLLTRVCFIVDYDATLRIKGDDLPFSETLKAHLTASEKSVDENTKIGFYKFHYFVPVSYWQGIHSSDQWEKGGIKVQALSDKKIYPLYSVWSPTSQNYLKLLEDYLEEKRNMIKSRKNIIDIGCGTGVLSFMTVQKIGSKDVYALDANPKAVECTQLNAQLLDMTDSVKVELLDVVNAVKTNSTENKLKEAKFPTKYELIIANPPWITASLLNTEHALDNGVYDPKEAFLTSIFKFAAKHLTVQTTFTKNGILLLYYSDLSQILDLQAKDRIEQLCKENNLTITNTYSTRFIEDNYLGSAENDPLTNFKNQAHVLLYEITRI